MASSFIRRILCLAILAVASAAAASCNKQTPAPPAGQTRVTGTAVDARTGKPIVTLSVIPGSMGGGDYVRHIRREDARNFSAGHFQTDLDHKIPARIIWVEAPGYLPYVSPTIGELETQRTLDIQLRPAPPITGTVVTASGRPVKGASVLLASPFEKVQFFNGMYTEKEAAPGAVWTRSDDAGHFSLPPREGNFKVAVAADDGLAVVTGEDLAAGSIITLKPWGKIEGILMQGEKPWAGVKVGLDWVAPYVEGQTSVDYAYDPVTTDKDGRFFFPRVHAYTTNINVSPPDAGPSGPALINYGPVSVQLGQTVQVRYGDEGRPVTGAIDLSAFGSRSTFDIQSSILCREGPPMALPANWPAMSPREKETWYNEWQSRKAPSTSAAGDATPCYAITVDAQGRYQLPAVAPGLYMLRVQVYEKGTVPGETREHIGRGFDLVLVPETTAGWNGEALSVSTLKPDALSVLRLGDAAPATPFEKPDGTSGSLSDFRGKVVVVDVWATWCPPCVAAIPRLNLMQQLFADHADVAMVALSVDDDKAAWKNYLGGEKFSWTQGYIGPWRSDGIGPPDGKISGAWGVHSLPAMFVVGKNGKVIFKGEDGPAMMAAIRAAL